MVKTITISKQVCLGISIQLWESRGSNNTDNQSNVEYVVLNYFSLSLSCFHDRTRDNLGRPLLINMDSWVWWYKGNPSRVPVTRDFWFYHTYLAFNNHKCFEWLLRVIFFFKKSPFVHSKIFCWFLNLCDIHILCMWMCS